MISFACNWLRRDVRWRLSLAGAVAANMAFLGLVSLADFGPAQHAPAPRVLPPITVIRWPRVPHPPVYNEAELLPEDQRPILPRRLQRNPAAPAGLPSEWQAPERLRPRLNLGLTACADPEERSASPSGCVPAPEWQRTDRDATALLGPSVQGLSQDAVAIARGWIKARPGAQDRQSAMASETDVSAPELRGLIFKDAPFPPEPGAQAAGP